MVQNPAESNQAERVLLRSLSSVPPGTEFEIARGGSFPEDLAGCTAGRQGSRLSIELDPFTATASLSPGDLVEVRTVRFLYLGQVRALRGQNITVILEHAVDLGLLDAVRHIWNRPAPGEAFEKLALALAIDQVPK